MESDLIALEQKYAYSFTCHWEKMDHSLKIGIYFTSQNINTFLKLDCLRTSYLNIQVKVNLSLIYDENYLRNYM